MKLAYKTRGDSLPYGKRRVYFSAHPEDYDLLDVIADDILKMQDCAVYYDAEPLAAYEKKELYENLAAIQLLVIPVTEKLLREKNRALDVEYSYAIRNHIPVLPFLQRKGLSESRQEERGYYGNLANEFNERLRLRFSRRTKKLEAGLPEKPWKARRLPAAGRLKESGEKISRYQNLQMLNKYDKDPTAIPYEEKLKKFLSSVLVSDELAKRIRDAFDAYIFLSYRKKDREHANKLIRLIHGNEFCRSIAIWFDEFLVPGESFSMAIEQAMEKSSLFVFAVTPNVLEEPNFVKDEEYVRAKKAADQEGKVIFPVELIPLDGQEKAELQEKFPGIPRRVGAVGDMADEEKRNAFSRELLNAVKRSGIRFGEGTPEHNFLLGMAYMNGIDVEKDVARGLELIRGAAQSGLWEAVFELVDMYGTGKGVALDYREAARWQERAVQQLREAYAAGQDMETAQKLIDGLAELGDYRYGVRDLEGAEAAYQEMEGILETFRELSPQEELASGYFAEYCMKMAKNLYAAGKLGMAEEYCLKQKKYIDSCNNDTVKMENRTMLGHLHRKQGKLDQAEKDYQEAYEIAAKSQESVSAFLRDFGEKGEIRENFTTLERMCRTNFMYCCNTMGRINAEKGNAVTAKAYYSRMLEMCRQLEEEDKTPESRKNLALACAKMGDVSGSLNLLEDSESYLQEALEIYEDLYTRYGTMEVRRGVSLANERLGDICMKKNRPDEAMEYYKRSFELNEALYEDMH
ncbi:MAG TPA: hypothetical protein DCZ91_13365 [Lachnospiraceae bacterium]|nr:hypothetical protein [Lachnospiraceae bacterium]